MIESTQTYIAAVVDQHAEELAILWHIRRRLARAGHVALRHLARFDERIAAHADGIVVNGVAGLQAVRSQLDPPDDGRMFAATVSALGLGDRRALSGCLDLLDALPRHCAGVASAFGWISSQQLAGIAPDLAASASAQRRSLAITACRLHGVDPGPLLVGAVRDTDPIVRSAAWRAVADLGRTDLAAGAAQARDDPDSASRLWAAVAALRHGRRTEGLSVLLDLATEASRAGRQAWRLAAVAQPIAAARDWLRAPGSGTSTRRDLVEGVGLVGDPAALPWLIEQATDDTVARAAGAAFALITGVDIAYQDLDRKPPAEIPGEPNDDPADDNVEVSDDDGLPWPDAAKLKTWWTTHRGRFLSGTRHFFGAPVGAEVCTAALAAGFQNQRRVAAEHRCLLEPGTRWFGTSAPSWRQKRWLAAEAAPATAGA